MFFSACQSTSTVSKTDPKTAVTVESEKANTFFEEAFEESLARSPMFQSYLGIKDNQGKWGDISDERAVENLEKNKSRHKHHHYKRFLAQ